MIRSLFLRDKIFQIVLVVIILFFTPFESYNLKNARILKSEALKIDGTFEFSNRIKISSQEWK